MRKSHIVMICAAAVTVALVAYVILGKKKDDGAAMGKGRGRGGNLYFRLRLRWFRKKHFMAM